MAQDKTVHTKSLGDNRYRDLQVYYDKGGMNYWTCRAFVPPQVLV